MKIKSYTDFFLKKANPIYYFSTLAIILGIWLISCSKVELKSTYGACARADDPRFNVEDCKSPDNCHVKDLGDGYCRPSCGYLAVISENGKYRGYGGDGDSNTEDDPHFLTQDSISCNDLDKWGATDWTKIPLIDDLEPWEVIQAQREGRAIECCGSDQQVEKNEEANQ